jgi:hypothetical protein
LREECGTDGAAEISEQGDVHARRALRLEKVRRHRLGDPVGVQLAQARPSPPPITIASISSRFDGGCSCAENLDRAVDQLHRQRIALLERSFPDTAREGASALSSP